MTTKKAKKEEDDDKPVDVDEYKGENDEELEGEQPEEGSDKEVESKVDEVSKGQISLDTTKHFETKDKEFQEIIASLPTFTPQDEQKIAKSYGDKRAAWELGHVHDSHFPIRFKVVENEKDGFVEYEMEEEERDGKIYKSFKFVEKYYEGQSLTPAHKDKIISMENEEQIFFSKLDKIQRDIEHVVAIRNTIGAILNLSSKNPSKIKEDELKSYMKKMDESMKKLPEDLAETVKKIQNEAEIVTKKKNKFVAYAYFGISEDEYQHVFVNDVRDYAGVIQRRDNLRVPF